MICPNCQSNMPDKRSRCDRCGTDMTITRKILRASNLYYNIGLAKARVRDLSGAIVALRKSLELNKTNTNARNLLGLVYFEMGETVAALSEWVISKHFAPSGNDAEEYINAVQSNPTKLDSLNQAIKRYNNALTYAKQGSDDLAIIQLKRVITLNPHFIRAFQLLALLYIKNGDTERAMKCLMRAGKIDVSNTTTLRYLQELEQPALVGRDIDGDAEGEKSLTSSIMPVTSYKEDKPNIMAFVNLVLGVLIGLAVMAVLVIPSIKNNQTKDDKEGYVDYSAGLATLQEKENNIKILQQDNMELEQKITQLQTQIESIVIPEVNPTLYSPLFIAVEQYLDEISKVESERDFKNLANALLAIDTTDYEAPEAIELLDRIMAEVYPIVSQLIFEEGRSLYNDGKYDEALEILLNAYALNPMNENTIYFLGRAYHRLSDYDNATIFYNIIITNFRDSRRYDEAVSKLAEIPAQD